jgi:hypothetical protein
LIEGFSAGTAVTIGPLDLFHYHGEDYKVPLDPKLNAGHLTKKISDHIINIQVINLKEKKKKKLFSDIIVLIFLVWKNGK